MKPWEKACPACGGDGFADYSHTMPCGGPCHGTGYVPMTTDEMLEALLGSGGKGCDVLIYRISTGVRVDVTTNRNRKKMFDRGTLDDALRAALTAVIGNLEVVEET